MPRKRRGAGAGARLEVEVDLDNLAADELDDLMNLDAQGQQNRNRRITLPRVAWLERPVSKPSVRERTGHRP